MRQNLLILSDYLLTLTAMIDQGEFFDIPSPCRRICELNNRGYCKGCFRSRDERLYWNQFTTFQKQLVVNLCEKRRLKVLSAKQATPVVAEEEISIQQPDLFNAAVNTSPAEETHLLQTITPQSETEQADESGMRAATVPTSESKSVTEQAENTDESAMGQTKRLFADQGDVKNESLKEKTPAEKTANAQSGPRKDDGSQLDMFR
ncbi:MAG: DUF1289 domain-containing protein [Saccharospirillaceae bacterium]|nr:DUF1289 domain-containing protein [Saccharospirillaceae bacterium]MCD8532009.1 DUF1289 domain-containing protein [Saccharospirillaceae bacterium]